MYFERALEINPADPTNLANYAGFLFARGRGEEANGYLDKTLELTDEELLKLECHFYRYAHTEDEKERAEALKEVKELIASGVRSPKFDLSQNVTRAIEDGHPEPEFLALLAKVIADEADASELDKFEVWKKA